MIKYNFDDIADRKGSNCVKYDMLGEFFGADDILPMWVADMDFRTPDFILDAIRRRCDHEVLGYTFSPESYKMAVLNWFQKHYGVSAKWKTMHFIPGIVQGIAFAMQAFTVPGDKVLITTPVYPPFLNVPHRTGRIFVSSPLKTVDGRFCIDFEDLEKKAAGCKMMILCNPHNPGGTVWSGDELRNVADICKRNNVLVISDEIHADLTFPEYRHTTFSSVSETAAGNSITFFAPSKTFNMAGLASSVCYVPDIEVRKKFFAYLDGNELSLGNIFGYYAAEAAFSKGEEWLRQLLEYLTGNIAAAESYVSAEMPELKIMRPQASFLLWIDFRAWNIPHKDLVHKLVHEAKIGLNSGLDYGPEGEGFMRMNIGTNRATVLEGLRRIATVRPSAT
ncbi:MAG: MalY/PatB family protein [Bacteroidales bacterium]|nr:MalY/PatB family protein [Bacteroidales bacterium]MDY6347196.1 MalY/PatB family protein [Bacteroidales bacterium]